MRPREQLLDLKAEFLIVDCITDTFGGDENNRSQVRQYGQMALGGLAREADCAVIGSRHPSLTGLQSGSGTSGTTEWDAVFRSRLLMTTPKDKDNEPKDSYRRLLEIMKANYGQRGETIDLFWSDGVFMLEEEDAKRPRRLCEEVFLLLLDELDRQGRSLSHKVNAPNYAPRELAKQPRDMRSGYSKDQFEQAMQALFKAKLIRITDRGEDGRRLRAEKIVRNQRG